jgi:hypothetical protein
MSLNISDINFYKWTDFSDYKFNDSKSNLFYALAALAFLATALVAVYTILYGRGTVIDQPSDETKKTDEVGKKKLSGTEENKNPDVTKPKNDPTNPLADFLANLKPLTEAQLDALDPLTKGVCYFFGVNDSKTKDEKRGLELLKKCADNDDGDLKESMMAKVFIDFYESEQRVRNNDISPERAAHIASLLEKDSSKNLYYTEFYELGLCYCTGEGVKKDVDKGNEYILRVHRLNTYSKAYAFVYLQDLLSEVNWYRPTVEQ